MMLYENTLILFRELCCIVFDYNVHFIYGYCKKDYMVSILGHPCIVVGVTGN